MSTQGLVRLAGSVGPWQLGWHDDVPNPYRSFRYPAEVIEHAVWLYHCFRLRLHDGRWRKSASRPVMPGLDPGIPQGKRTRLLTF